jgi:hypothetical protein
MANYLSYCARRLGRPAKLKMVCLFTETKTVDKSRVGQLSVVPFLEELYDYFYMT